MWFACAAHPQEKPKPEIIALIDPPAPAANPSIAFDGACRWRITGFRLRSRAVFSLGKTMRKVLP